MSVFTKLATAALTTLTAAAFVATPALAGNNGTFEEHQALWNTIQSVGVSTHINPAEICKDGLDGAYISSIKAMVICQDNGRPGGPQVEWTANDLDTLRHEAQHLIQDCNSGTIGDDKLGAMMGSDREVIEFAMGGSLGRQGLEHIARSYSAQGVSRDTIILEFEAWAVGADIDATRITNAVNTYCGA